AAAGGGATIRDSTAAAREARDVSANARRNARGFRSGMRLLNRTRSAIQHAPHCVQNPAYLFASSAGLGSSFGAGAGGAADLSASGAAGVSVDSAFGSGAIVG